MVGENKVFGGLVQKLTHRKGHKADSAICVLQPTVPPGDPRQTASHRMYPAALACAVKHDKVHEV